MRVIVDPDLCESNAICVSWAPSVFGVDEQGRMVLLAERPGPEHAGDLRQAIEHCPRGALALMED